MLEGGAGKKRFMLGRGGAPGPGAGSSGASMLARRAMLASASKQLPRQVSAPGVVECHHEELPADGGLSAPSSASSAAPPTAGTDLARGVARLGITENPGSPAPPLVAEESRSEEKTAKVLFAEGDDNVPPPPAVSPKNASMAAASGVSRPVLGKREPLSPSRPSNSNAEGFSRLR
jgi:hypothetical protein